MLSRTVPSIEATFTWNTESLPVTCGPIRSESPPAQNMAAPELR